MKRIKVFIDSCNPQDSITGVQLLGEVHGQTTNPTLLTKNPDIQTYLEGGKKLTRSELLKLYKEAVTEIQKYVHGPISVEVYADWETTADAMLETATEMKEWGPYIYIKFPTIPHGLVAARKFTLSGGQVNMTLVFDTLQAAAVYSATRDTVGTAFVSPFVGRWDDKGFYGLDVVRHIRTLYNQFDTERGTASCHVEILAASLRSSAHIEGAIALGADIVTAPLSVYTEWVTQGKPMATTAPAKPDNLVHLPEKPLTYTDDFASYHFETGPDSLLSAGLLKFAADWKSVCETQ